MKVKRKPKAEPKKAHDQYCRAPSGCTLGCRCWCHFR